MTESGDENDVANQEVMDVSKNTETDTSDETEVYEVVPSHQVILNHAQSLNNYHT